MVGRRRIVFHEILQMDIHSLLAYETGHLAMLCTVYINTSQVILGVCVRVLQYPYPYLLLWQ